MIDKVIQNKLRDKYNPDGSDLRNHQLQMLEMLMFIDQICVKHNINYWLSSGSCLGAIRHNGFIPWDDDIDIEMMREDFLKFEEVFIEDDEYILQTQKNDHFYFNSFAKLRLKNSQIYDSLYKYKGVFIDIFPLEYTNHAIAKFAEKIRIPVSWYLYNYIKRSNLPLQKKILSVFFLIYKKLYFCLIPILRLITRFCFNNKLRHTYGVGWTRNIRYEKDIFPIKRVLFEGKMFPVPGNYDMYLTRIFGDYMAIPKEEQIKEPHVQYFIKKDV